MIRDETPKAFYYECLNCHSAKRIAKQAPAPRGEHAFGTLRNRRARRFTSRNFATVSHRISVRIIRLALLAMCG